MIKIYSFLRKKVLRMFDIGVNVINICKTIFRINLISFTKELQFCILIKRTSFLRKMISKNIYIIGSRVNIWTVNWTVENGLYSVILWVRCNCQNGRNRVNFFYSRKITLVLITSHANHFWSVWHILLVKHF